MLHGQETHIIFKNKCKTVVHEIKNGVYLSLEQDSTLSPYPTTQYQILTSFLNFIWEEIQIKGDS